MKTLLACLLLTPVATLWSDEQRPTVTDTAEWASPLPFPEGMQPLTPGRYTQEIAVTDGRDRITPVLRSKLKAEWQVSGGMVGLTGWKSEKYVLLPAERRTWVGTIQVKNSLGYMQPNRAILRSYPDGTRFDDVLTNAATGKVFEHRTREKNGGKWQSRTPFKDEAERPAGYNGLAVSCASCHDQAGSGGYAAGLVPGGDTVLSEELDWSVWRGMR